MKATEYERQNTVLCAENAALREALSQLSKVYDAMGGKCGTVRIAAEEALLGKAHREKNGG